MRTNELRSGESGAVFSIWIVGFVMAEVLKNNIFI
jgi:hypothetical protein